VKGKEMPVCLVDPEQLASVVDTDSTAQESLTVRKPSGKGQLRVLKSHREVLKIPQDRLDKWQLPN